MVIDYSLLAGGLVAAASLPKIVATIRRRTHQENQPLSWGDVLRDLLIIIGNVVWIAYGVHHGIAGLLFFGLMNAALTSVLVVQQVWWRRTSQFRVRCDDRKTLNKRQGR